MDYTDFLIVDDDDAFRNRLAKALRERQYLVRTASSVAEALKDIRLVSPKRIILDLRMPEESGISLLEELFKTSPSPEVLVLTGYGSIATATKAIKLGATNYLTKPAGIEEILRAFSEAPSPQGQTSVPSLDQVEWEHLQRVLSDCEGNVSQAAKLLGMHRRSLQRKLQKAPAEIK